MKRLFPAPLVSASLFALWLVLARSWGPGHVVLAALVAVIVPILSAPLRPLPVRIRRPLVILRLIMTVGYDVIMSNLQVARGVLHLGRRPPHSEFVRIPLDLHDTHGLAALAMITTVVPGTVWSELAADRSVMLLHVWDFEDEEDFVRHFKARYERPLREIFE